MEIPDQDLLLLRYVRQKQSIGNDTAVSSQPQQEQKSNNQFESNQDTLEPKYGPPTLALIEVRIQQLNNRRFLLLKTQRFRKKEEDNSGRTTEEITDCEDSNEQCELEAIQKELDRLLVTKEKLEKQGKTTRLTGNKSQQNSPTFYKVKKPCGGIYMLPPPQLTQEGATSGLKIKSRPAAEIPTGPIVPVDSLGPAPAITKCPSCDAVVLTETCRTVNTMVWMLCCITSMMGCVAGCCLIPFFMDRLKTVKHKCPQCQADIYTYKPL
ncbi:hypothetical protein PAMP_010575 [Pampus punctatissimus]